MYLNCFPFLNIPQGKGHLRSLEILRQTIKPSEMAELNGNNNCSARYTDHTSNGSCHFNLFSFQESRYLRPLPLSPVDWASPRQFQWSQHNTKSFVKILDRCVQMRGWTGSVVKNWLSFSNQDRINWNENSPYEHSSPVPRTKLVWQNNFAFCLAYISTTTPEFQGMGTFYFSCHYRQWAVSHILSSLSITGK